MCLFILVGSVLRLSPLCRRVRLLFHTYMFACVVVLACLLCVCVDFTCLFVVSVAFARLFCLFVCLRCMFVCMFACCVVLCFVVFVCVIDC